MLEEREEAIGLAKHTGIFYGSVSRERIVLLVGILLLTGVWQS